MPSLLRTIINANRSLSRRIEKRLPQAREDLFEEYEATVARYMNARPRQLVVDVGGGKQCPFARYRRPEDQTRIVAVDISEDEIRHNRDVDEARVANIMQELPFGPNEADLIVSRSVLEHLTDLEAFVRASANVIKPGGHFIHLFPNRSAPFALINRMLPNAASRRLVHFLHPETVGICGFPAFYDHCSAEAITRLLEKHGFVIEELRVSYYQSGYFTFFVPAYLVSAAYEMVLHSLDARSLAAYVMVVARKK